MASVLVGMSGGVDSSVAAAMLLEQGYEVVGGYMKNWTNEEGLPGDCPWEQDIRDAREVCEYLGIEFRILSLMDEYRDRVVEYLLSGYRDGITPNPDVMCNREMKFGIFREFSMAQGFDHVATGHYAQIRKNVDESFDIYRGAKGKDQTYFLALLEQEQFRKALFPIGHLPKPEVRKEAQRFGVPVADKKDSQGICFIGDIKMSDFLGHYIDINPGDIITLDGKKVGGHQGLHLHTLGQRKGLGVPSNTYGKAYVVVEKRPATNELVVAFDEPETPGLYATRCRVGSISVTNRALSGTSDVLVQPRYRCEASPVTLDFVDDDTAEVTFEIPQRALTPGQICGFYEGEKLLGGGVFQQIYHPAKG
ncbi:tRNA 2-thiouridine(34) synthase MnmA [Verrucomicrobiales bacterium]|nr:tRNA 2-thiouridine(34) synthase MnmA [Verrucomicrobiales bacterium]MDA7926903.1 tRNA 2-thiouridine(34) synthase MnmA [Verrucomicrobiales bacterium]